MLQQVRGSSSSKGEPLQSLHMVHLDNGLTQMPTPGSRLCCPAFMCHMVSEDDVEGPKSMRGVEPQATRRHFLIGELLFSTHRLLHARRYARPTAADEAAAGEGGAGGPTELSVARATRCAAICEASSRLFARTHISARGGRHDAAAR